MCKQESKNGYIQKKYTTLYNHYFVEKPHPALFIGVNCILRSPAVANAFWNGRFAEHNDRPLLVD